jgi:hypothetical protein
MLVLNSQKFQEIKRNMNLFKLSIKSNNYKCLCKVSKPVRNKDIQIQGFWVPEVLWWSERAVEIAFHTIATQLMWVLLPPFLLQFKTEKGVH